MTTSNTNDRSGPYAGDGISTNLTVSFYFLTAAEVVATRLNADGSTTILSNGGATGGIGSGDYTISGAGNSSGGAIVLNAPATSFPVGSTITITPLPSVTQQQAYPAGGTFPSKATEQGFDRLTIIALFLQEQINRCAKLNVTTAVSQAAGPIIGAGSPNASLVFDTAGVNIVAGPTSTAISSAQSYALAAASSASAAAASQSAAASYAGQISTVVNAYVIYDLGGTANTYTIAPSPAITVADKVVVTGRINITNTGASTLNPNGLGAAPIITAGGNALTGGEMVAGATVRFVYQTATSSWRMEGAGGASHIIAATSGTIDNVVIGGTTKAAGNFTTVTAVGAISAFNLNAGGAATALSGVNQSSSVNTACVLALQPSATNGKAALINSINDGSDNIEMLFYTSSAANTQYYRGGFKAGGGFLVGAANLRPTGTCNDGDVNIAGVYRINGVQIANKYQKIQSSISQTAVAISGYTAVPYTSANFTTSVGQQIDNQTWNAPSATCQAVIDFKGTLGSDSNTSDRGVFGMFLNGGSNASVVCQCTNIQTDSMLGAFNYIFTPGTTSNYAIAIRAGFDGSVPAHTNSNDNVGIYGAALNTGYKIEFIEP